MSIVNPVNVIEVQEVIQKLKDNGFSELVDCLLDNEMSCYTKKGRLNKSATSRLLGWKSKQLEDALNLMKEVLGPEFLDIEEDDDDDDDDEEEEVED